MDKPGGRAEDIETGLSTDWWRTLFDKTYLLTDADAVEDPGITAWEVGVLLDATGVFPHHRIVDLCCGQGRHCIELAQRGYSRVTGVDGSEYLIGVARERAKGQVRFEVGDVRNVSPKSLGHADLVTLLGNSFGYMENEGADLDVLRAALGLLVPGGQVYLDIADGDWLREHFATHSWEWISDREMAVRERKLSGDRLVSREMVVHVDRGVTADRTYAERLYSKASLTALLKAAGFTDVRIGGNLGSGGSDPGMMAHRFLVGARRPEAKVTVLLGDPSLPDRVKPGGQFGAADFDTLARMKAALATLDGFQFRYVDDHADLVDALNDAGDLVLNLCDEGYRNDPRGEAIVPAILEALDVPYTGCPPASLVLCYDKAVVRALAHRHNIPVPDEMTVSPGSPVPAWRTFPAFVKPALGDSSVGIDASSVVYDQDALEKAVVARWKHGPVLVQEFLLGAEYSVGLVGNGVRFLDLPVLQVDYTELGSEVPILGYESKWIAGSPWWDRVKYRAACGDHGQLREWSEVLFRMLRCRDYARFDWRCGADGVPRLLEVNPNPGWCWDGKMALMAQMAGNDYPWFLRSVLLEGLARRAS